MRISPQLKDEKNTPARAPLKPPCPLPPALLPGPGPRTCACPCPRAPRSRPRPRVSRQQRDQPLTMHVGRGSLACAQTQGSALALRLQDAGPPWSLVSLCGGFPDAGLVPVSPQGSGGWMAMGRDRSWLFYFNLGHIIQFF